MNPSAGRWLEQLQAMAWPYLWLPHGVRCPQQRTWGRCNSFAAFPVSELSSEAPSLSLIQRHPSSCRDRQVKDFPLQVPAEVLPPHSCTERPSARAAAQWPLSAEKLVHSGEFPAPSTSLWGFTAGKCLGVYWWYTMYGSKPKVMEGFTASREKADESCAVDLKSPDF